jgi:acid stress-induced BolA-like protein IbaG/YrbA
MNKLLLQEYLNPSTAKTNVMLEEGQDAFGNKAKHMYMEGLFIQGDIRNANGRVYPKNEIYKAVKTIQEQLSTGISICGEVDHPDDLKINLDRVSHCIISMNMSGSDGIGKLKILPTPMGQLVKTMLESNVKLGVSSRGSGNVNDMNGQVSDFEIITVDIVAQPSAPDAYPKAIYESLMNYKNGNHIHAGLTESLEIKKFRQSLQKDITKFISNLKL